MKKNRIYFQILILALVIAFSGCSEKVNYDPILPAEPTGFSVSQGDTSVFLNWNPVPGASSYLVVRGLSVIADSIMKPTYIDDFGPDTLVEYRVYAVNEDGWRSYRYASGEGNAIIPTGLLPRAPNSVSASDGVSYKDVNITWKGGRFAKSFNIYKGANLIAENVVGNSFVDAYGSLDPKEYRIKSVNSNGESLTYRADMGNKTYFFIDNFELDAVGFTLPTWTVRVPAAKAGYQIAYNGAATIVPIVTNSDGYNGSSKCISLGNGGNTTIRIYSPGVPEAGMFRCWAAIKCSAGAVTFTTDFAGKAEVVSATGNWVLYGSPITSLLAKSAPIKFAFAYSGGNYVLLDNIAFEYITPPKN